MKDLPVEKVREGFERLYQECRSLEPSFDLMVGLHDYIQYLNNHPLLDYLFNEKVQKSARELLEQVKDKENQTINELEKVCKVLTKVVKKNKIEDKTINLSLSEFEHYSTGRYRSSRGKAESMFYELKSVVEILANSPQTRKLVSDYFIPPEPSEQRPRFGKVKLSESFEIFEQLKTKFERRQEVSPWGAFDVIFKSFQAIQAYAYGSGESLEREATIDFYFIASAVKAVKDNEKHSDDALKMFFSDYSKAVLGRLHLALLNELDKHEQKKNRKVPEKIIERLDTETFTHPSNDDSPEVLEVGKEGYFKFRKNGAKIRIGKSTTRQYRLIKALIFPLGTNKIIESIFDEIGISRDGDDPRLKDYHTAHERKVELINWAIKEIQKIPELQGRLLFEFSPDNKRSICMKLGQREKI